MKKFKSVKLVGEPQTASHSQIEAFLRLVAEIAKKSVMAQSEQMSHTHSPHPEEERAS